MTLFCPIQKLHIFTHSPNLCLSQNSFVNISNQTPHSLLPPTEAQLESWEVRPRPNPARLPETWFHLYRRIWSSQYGVRSNRQHQQYFLKIPKKDRRFSLKIKGKIQHKEIERYKLKSKISIKSKIINLNLHKFWYISSLCKGFGITPF